MPNKIKNNFGNFKDSFKKDTGLDAKENMSEYIAYANFRINDYFMQTNNFRLQEIETRIRFESDNIKVISNNIRELKDSLKS